jgi:hypothetical protein
VRDSNGNPLARFFSEAKIGMDSPTATKKNGYLICWFAVFFVGGTPKKS